jgi:two-component system chemotaxis sensor kinase CheA
MPDVRLAQNKPKKGTIKLSSYYQGAYVCIRITDDGAGINKTRVKAKAIESGLIKETDELTDDEINNLIFAAGFSTAEEVTDLSGRGVGMDVVRRNIADLRGHMILNSVEGEGTDLIIKLPLTLSIIDGLLVTVLGENYILPLMAINKCFEVPYDSLADSINNILILEGGQIPFINLRKKFDSSDNNPPETTNVILTEIEGKMIGLCVDSIEGQYQAVLKPLGEAFCDQDFISGASILGDGTVALVIDINNLVLFSEKKTELEAVEIV